MPISVNNTTITFNDATTQTTGFTNPIPVANGGTGANNAPSARINLGAGTGNGNGNGNGNGFGNGNGNGNVTSVATGNGLQGGTITGGGTLSVACPGFNTVGSYCQVVMGGGGQFTPGANYNPPTVGSGCYKDGIGTEQNNNLSGTWKYMGAQNGNTGIEILAVGCRVS